MTPLLYVGIHVVSFAARLERCMISYNKLERRREPFAAGRWILDSGAFTRITSGRGHAPPDEYARAIDRWADCGTLEAAVSQDWMCEPFVLEITGLSVREHQRLTTANYLDLRERVEAYVMPVVQGYTPKEYARHADELAPHLEEGAWVGLGSVCKRQGSPDQLSAIISAVLDVRPDLRLHGFGVKRTALERLDISSRLWSVDSMAWSFAGRRETPQRQNDLAYAQEWAAGVEAITPEPSQVAMGL